MWEGSLGFLGGDGEDCAAPASARAPSLRALSHRGLLGSSHPPLKAFFWAPLGEREELPLQKADSTRCDPASPTVLTSQVRKWAQRG